MALSPTSSRGSSGTAPHTHEVVTTSPAVSIANGDFGVLTWDQSAGPDSLLNLAVPTLPTIKTTGTYAFSVSMSGANFTTAGYFVASLELDAAGEDFYMQLVSNTKTGFSGPLVLFAATLYMTAGMQLKATIQTNADGVATRDFVIAAALIQRLA